MIRRAGAALLLALAAACGGASQAPKESPLTLAVGGAPNEIELWEKLCADFTAASGIPVELERQPASTDQRRQSLVLALGAKRPDPDLFLVDVAWIAQFGASGWLMPLDDLLPAAGLDANVFFPSILKTADTWNGRLIALPVYVDAGLLYYRKDLVDAPPRTWDELSATATRISAARRAEDPSFAGYVWQGAQYEGLVCHFQEVAVSAGGGLSDSAGRLTIATPANIRALEFLRNTIHSSKISPSNTFTEMKEEEVRRHFQDGHALFERNWPYAWALHSETSSAVRGNVGISPLPSFEGHAPAATLGGWHAAISAHTEKREAAAKLLAFLLSPTVQKRCARELGWNPGRRDVYSDSELARALPHLQALAPVFENAVARPNLAFWPLVSERLQEHLNSALAGRVEPKAALEAAAKEIDETVRQYGG